MLHVMTVKGEEETSLRCRKLNARGQTAEQRNVEKLVAMLQTVAEMVRSFLGVSWQLRRLLQCMCCVELTQACMHLHASTIVSMCMLSQCNLTLQVQNPQPVRDESAALGLNGSGRQLADISSRLMNTVATSPTSSSRRNMHALHDS